MRTTQEFDNTNRGALFKADKQGNEKRPDYSGSLNVNGQEFWISAWIREGQKGKFMSLSVKPKEQQQERRPPPQRNSYAEQSGGSRFADMDDDIPF